MIQKTDRSSPETDNKNGAIVNQGIAVRTIYTSRNVAVCDATPVLDDVNKRNDDSNQNISDTCNIETQKNELTEMIKLIHDFNDDVTELMKLTYSVTYPEKGIIKMSDCYGNSSWIDMPEGSRRLRISKCLNKARAVVKHERSIRDHFTITNNSLNGSVDICNYIHNIIEKISRMMRNVIFTIRGSNIDPYFFGVFQRL